MQCLLHQEEGTNVPVKGEKNSDRKKFPVFKS